MARWYNGREAGALAYQVVKYRARDGWSNRDLLRLAHPKAATPAHDALYMWIVLGRLPEAAPHPELRLIEAFEQAKRATDAGEVVRLIQEHGLPRECVPTESLGDARVWEALLERMPLGAMIRNLATMTRVGLVKPMSHAAQTVIGRLGDAARMAAARLHPIALLAALRTYAAGQGARGQHVWTPVQAVVDALDDAF